MYIIKLSEAIKEDLDSVGSKGLHLAKLLNEKVNIPDGFIIKSNAFYKFLKDNDINLNNNIDADFYNNFRNLKISNDIDMEIKCYFEKICPSFCDNSISLAVRSSSVAEDLPKASFAGQYDTFLNVKSFSALLDSTKACWKSSFSERVKKYEYCNDIVQAAFPMAVLVQIMVEADVSGVIFSMNPVNGDKNEIVINASYGLGEAIVSGLVIPDMFFINKKNNNISKILGEKEIKIVSDVNGTKEFKNTYEEKKRFCLSDEQVENLVNQTKIIENFYNCAVDIEFAIKNDDIYILQSRAITACGG